MVAQEIASAEPCDTCTGLQPTRWPIINTVMPKPTVLILNAGGIRSLVATAMVTAEDAQARVVGLHWRHGTQSPQGRLRYDHARRQAEHFQLHRLMIRQSVVSEPSASGKAPELAQAHEPFARGTMLLAAVAEAQRLRAGRLVWPVQAGLDVQRTAGATELTILAQHLAQADQQLTEADPAGGSLPEMQMPLLELTDAQVIELGHELRVPWQLAWTCLTGQGQPCRACAGCTRRRRAFEAARIEDPLHHSSLRVGASRR